MQATALVVDRAVESWSDRASLHPAFTAFQAQAIRDSGMHPHSVGSVLVEQVVFRLVLPDGQVCFDLGAEDHTPLGVTVTELIQPYHAVETLEWIARIFLAPDFARLKLLLQEQRVIVRYERSVSGEVCGHIIPVECSLMPIEAIERGLLILDSGEWVQDSITRMLGLRSKVRALLAKPQLTQESMQETKVGRNFWSRSS